MSLSCQPQLPYAFGLGRSVFHLPWADNHTGSDLSTHVNYLFPILMVYRLHIAFSFLAILPNWTPLYFFIAEMKVQMCAQYLVIASTTEMEISFVF